MSSVVPTLTHGSSDPDRLHAGRSRVADPREAQTALTTGRGDLSDVGCVLAGRRVTEVRTQ